MATVNREEQLYSIALSQLKGLSLLNAHTLLGAMGSASEVFAHRKEIMDVIPNATERLVDALANTDEALRMAEKELAFAEEKRLRVLAFTDDDYPLRLRECDDAPLVLYYCGSADLNRAKVVSIVGTRKCSEYGRELCQQFVHDLKLCYPDVLIVSGLAYGIDVCAHRAALENGMDTVGVLAHGLDMIYPTMHRQTAADMVHRGGGLLTEYMSETKIDKQNFVRRNRIVAGVCDACLVVESAAKGGSLITAELAADYNREVMAFPGRVFDKSFAGCNNLIRRHQATLITSAADFLEVMGWPNPLSKSESVKAVQQDLFPDLSDEERLLVNALSKDDDKHINQIVVETGIPYARASMLFFDMEMRGIVKALGGARYRLVRRGL